MYIYIMGKILIIGSSYSIKDTFSKKFFNKNKKYFYCIHYYSKTVSAEPLNSANGINLIKKNKLSTNTKEVLDAIID